MDNEEVHSMIFAFCNESRWNYRVSAGMAHWRGRREKREGGSREGGREGEGGSEERGREERGREGGEREERR